MWSCAVSLACWGYFVNEQRLGTPLEVVSHHPCYLATSGGSTLLTCGFDPHSQLPHHARWIDVVDVWVRSPLIASGALNGLDDEKAEAHNTPCIILGMGSERPLQFSFMV
jgi:hypothetical protein